jgi:hypothetical protein
MSRLSIAALLIVLGSPTGGLAFSFGDFTPGDQIESLIIVAGDGVRALDPNFPTTIAVRAEISTIDMTSGTQFGGISGLHFDADLDLSGSPLFLPLVGPTTALADFTGTIEIRDDGAGPVGSGPILLSGNFTDLVNFQAFPGVSGNLSGTFGELTGDPTFRIAFGSGADLNLQLSAFQTASGSASQVCHIGDTCFGATTAFRDGLAAPGGRARRARPPAAEVPLST